MSKTVKKSKFAVIIGIIWGIVFAVAIIGVIYIFTGYRIRSYSNPKYVLERLAYREYGDVYERLLSVMEYDYEIETREEYTEMMALKDYIEAAGTYTLFAEENDTERAMKAKERMDEAYSRLGLLSFTKEDIDEIVGLD